MKPEIENPPTDSDNAPSAEAVDNDALFACPFCGGDPKLIRVGNDHTRKRSVRIECSTFGCTVKMTVGAIRYSHDWCENVIREKWNRRQPVPVSTRHVLCGWRGMAGGQGCILPLGHTGGHGFKDGSGSLHNA